MSTEAKPQMMRITAVYEYELDPNLEHRQESYGTTDPAECGKVDAATDDPSMMMADADLKSVTITPIGDGAQPGGGWWIATDALAHGGEKVLGPFATRELALDIRRYVEAVKAPMTYWVDQETASKPADAQ